MNRRQLSLLAALGVLAALVVLLTLRNRQPPRLPDDAEHRSGASVEACLACHDPQGIRPRSPNHPVGRDCGRCHGSP
jgi:hypothetical protein